MTLGSLFDGNYTIYRDGRISAMGKTWCCWTARPTDEQREAEPWKS